MVKVNLLLKRLQLKWTEPIRYLLGACNVLNLCHETILGKLIIIRLDKISPKFIVFFWKSREIGPIQCLLNPLSSFQIRFVVIVSTSSSMFSSFKRFFFFASYFRTKSCLDSLTLVLYGPQFHSLRSDHANNNLMKIKNCGVPHCAFLSSPASSSHLAPLFSSILFSNTSQFILRPHWIVTLSVTKLVEPRCRAVDWGTALQAGRLSVRFAMVSLEFFIDSNFRPYYGPRVDSASNINKYQGYFLGEEGGRCVGLTTLPLSCADCL